MKRDMDLIREILLKAEESDSPDIPKDLSIEGYTKEQIKYHLMLLSDAKFITPEYSEVIEFGLVSKSGTEDNRPRRLTKEAHEFLDNARDDTNWQNAKRFVKDKGGSLTLEVIKGVLAQLARQAVGLP